jgi:hypothetical protein
MAHHKSSTASSSLASKEVESWSLNSHQSRIAFRKTVQQRCKWVSPRRGIS